MRQNMYERKSLSKNVGSPYIFSMMAYSRQWHEIKNALLPGRIAIDSAENSARVFRIKIRALTAFIIDETVFGEVRPPVRVISFRKRRYPRAHCLFLMTPTSKVNLLNTTSVDTIISAKLPDEQNNLPRQIAFKHNMHNPCGRLDPFAVSINKNNLLRTLSETFLSTKPPR